MKLDTILIFNMTDEVVVELVSHLRGLLRHLRGKGIDSLVRTRIIEAGCRAFPSAARCIRDRMARIAYDPVLAASDVSRTLYSPVIAVIYTGPITYNSAKAVYGSAGGYIAHLRMQHQRAVWHECSHAFGGPDCRNPSCMLKWETPTLELCRKCLASIKRFLKDRLTLISRERDCGFAVYDARIARRKQKKLARLIETLSKERGCSLSREPHVSAPGRRMRHGARR